MKRTLKILSAVLTAVMILSVVSAAAFASDGDFEIDGDGVLTQYTGQNSHVDIPRGVTAIGESAFLKCDGITYINIPDGVKSIGGGAFAGCENLQGITIPDSVESIGEGAFIACESLTGISLPTRLTVIENKTFFGCTALSDITIPGSVESIGEGAFWDCESLDSVTMTDNVREVGGAAFPEAVIDTVYYLCGSDRDAVAELMGDYCQNFVVKHTFWNDNCTSCGLSTLVTDENGIVTGYIGDGGTVGIHGEEITGIGERAFAGNKSITTVAIGENVTSIGEGAFEETSVSCANIRNVQSIGDRAFYNCNQLTTVTMSNSVESIGSQAFDGCTALTGLEMSKNAERIGDSAFGSDTEVPINIIYFNTCGDVSGIVAKMRSAGLKTDPELVVLLDHKFVNFICTECGYSLCPHESCTVSCEWSNDYTSCTAVKKCDVCENVLLSETAKEIRLVEDTAGKDCKDIGKGHYEATFEGFETVKTESIFDTKYGPHNYIDYICGCCGDELLDEAKAAAKSAVDSASGSSQSEEVKRIVAGAKANIEKAETIREVENAKQTALKAIEEQKQAEKPIIPVCPECGGNHPDNFFGKIICFFNRMINWFKNLF